MNKYFKPVITAFMSILSLLVYGDEVSSKKWFNPENTWEYMRVDKSSPSENDPLNQHISVSPYLMNYSGSETIDGKEYIRYDWKWKPEVTHLRPLNSHYLLREEDGAIYVYIGESEEPSYWETAEVEPGEYLLYDFNMEEGTEYLAPFAEGLNRDDGLALQSNLCLMGRFRVSSKSVDDEGRRVMILDALYVDDDPSYRLGESVIVVEGVGPITSESNVGAFYFPPIPLSVDPPAMFEFYGMFSPDGEEVYIIPAERESGFRKEKDYQWVYGVYDSEGKVKYIKTEFNYYAKYGEHFYRRFIILQVSENPDGEWQASHDPDRYLLREEDGKVYLRHSEGSTTTLLEDYKPKLESLIYDFNSGDTSKLKVYTTEGEQDFSISTSLTDVGGEEMRSYGLDDSNGVKCVEGIGVVQGGILPCVNSRFRLPDKDDNSSYCGAVLVAVYDGEGKLLFSQDMPSGLSEISRSDGLDALPVRIFDLQGRELKAPIPGQPYIKDGRILIAPSSTCENPQL